MNEVWKDIEGYNGLYQVSSLGRVKKLVSNDSLGRIRNNGKERILSLQTGKYKTVRLSTNGISKTYSVHELVSRAFLKSSICCPTCGNNLEIHHKDNDPYNNISTNLTYVSRKENVQLSSIKTQKSCWKKLTAENVREIKKIFTSGSMTNIDIALKFNVSPSTICDIKKERLWKSIN